MTDRDRIADIMADAAERQCAAWDRQGVPPWQGLCDFGFIADRLIAAGVTLPEPTCGAGAVVDGNEYVCDQPPHHAARFAPVRFTWPHSCTDSAGTVRWWDGPDGAGGCRPAAAPRRHGGSGATGGPVTATHQHRIRIDDAEGTPS